MAQRVLIIEDEESIAWALRKACERRQCQVDVTPTAEEGLKLAEKRQPNVIFLDIKLPGMDGLTALGNLKKLSPRSAIVVMTAHGNLSTAVRAVEGGAFDYLAKPFDLDTAIDALNRASTPSAGRQKPPEDPPGEANEELVGQSPAIQGVFKRIAMAAPTDACVLITGESGTGKELVARALHAHSGRKAKPFVPVHVAALNPNLVESELFGHAKGSFTGAERAKAGLLALADGGTVFLDELADIPLHLQAKLLRVLERQEVQPVGSAESQRVNVRIISATHADLTAAVAEGKFRHDLFFRLNVFPIHLPPLRERGHDLVLLAERFLAQFTAGQAKPLSAETINYLKSRRWPGNVRELRNAIEHAAIVSRGGTVSPEHIPPELPTRFGRRPTQPDHRAVGQGLARRP